jgi:hypothetical protein
VRLQLFAKQERLLEAMADRAAQRMLPEGRAALSYTDAGESAAPTFAFRCACRACYKYSEPVVCHCSPRRGGVALLGFS